MYSEVHSQDIERYAQAPAVAELLAFYRTLRGKGLPALTDFSETLLAPHLPSLMILERLDGGEYLYRHYGTNIAAVANIDMTGKTTADFNSPAGQFFKEMYERSVELLAPIYTVHKAVHAKLAHTWERLLLPVRMENGAIGFIVFNRPRSFESDYLRTVLEMVPDGIYCLHAIRNDDGRIVDARFDSANSAAQRLLGRTAEELKLLTFLSAYPQALPKGIWAHIVSTIERRKTSIREMSCEIDREIRWHRMTITPMGDGVVVHLTDITDLKREMQAFERRQLEMALSIKHHKNESDELRRLATTDSLTGVMNRRGFFSVVREVLAKSRQGEARFVAVLTDIDRFKLVNDRYGHSVGDKVLQHFAGIISEWASEHSAIVGRLGGEEFVILMPIQLREALGIVDRLRTLVSITPAMTELGPVPITASFGLAEWADGERIDHLLERADEALYGAKAMGRNVVVTNEEQTAAKKVQR